MDAAQRLLDLVSQRDLALVQLAEIVSIAAQIEPELLRLCRLTLLPEADAGVEADLWFSPLAQSQTSDSLVLRADVLPLLRERLLKPNHPIGLHRARRVLHDAHRQADAGTRLEEQLTYLALSCPLQPGVRQSRHRRQIDRLLRNVVIEMSLDEERGRRLARWAANVLPRLPEAARAVESFTLARIAASLLLDGRRIVQAANTAQARLDTLSLIVPKNLAPLPVRVRLTLGGLEIGNIDEAGAQLIQVPRTNPLFAQITWRVNGGEHSQLLSWAPEEYRSIAALANEFEIRTAVGEIFTLRSEQPISPPPMPSQEAPAQAATEPELLPPIEGAWPSDRLADYPAHDFRVRVVRNGDYSVRVLNSPSGEAQARFGASFEELQSRAARFETSFSGSSLAQLREFGEQLYSALFTDEVLKLFLTSLEAARQQSSALRIALELDEAPELQALPWELMFDRAQDRFLALSAETSLFRRSSQIQGSGSISISALPPRGLLRVLIVSANPSELPPVDVDREYAGLTASLGERGVVIDRLEGATFHQMETQLAREEYHVLVFVGHWVTEPKSGATAFVFEAAQRRSDPVAITTVSKTLQFQRGLRWLILDVERSIRHDTSNWLRTLTLLANDLAAIGASNQSTGGASDGTFWGEVLGRAALGAPLDLAMTEARKATYSAGQAIAWSTPILYAPDPDALVLRDLPKMMVTDLWVSRPEGLIVRQQGHRSNPPVDPQQPSVPFGAHLLGLESPRTGSDGVWQHVATDDGRTGFIETEIDGAATVSTLKPGEVWVSADSGVNLRAQPTLRSTTTTKLPKGAHLTTVGSPQATKQATWRQVMTDDGLIGWIATSLDGVSTVSDVPLHQAEPQYVVVKSGTGSVSIQLAPRIEPSMQIGVLNEGARLELDTSVADWHAAKVYVATSMAEVSDKYLRPSGNWNTINIRSAPRTDPDTNVGDLAHGQQLELIDTRADWFVARVYLSAQYTDIVSEQLQTDFNQNAAAFETAITSAVPWGKCLAGLGMGSVQPLTPIELEVIRKSRIEAFKMLTLPDPNSNTELIKQLYQIRSDMFIVARLFFPADVTGRTRFAPTDFVKFVSNGLEAGYEAGVRYFEVHNEPNSEMEGLGWNWQDGAEFGQWLLEVLKLLRAEFPEARFGYPALSPRPNDLKFLDDSAHALAQCDWLGAHSYWHAETQSPYPMTGDDGGMYWRRYRDHYPDKLLMITEFSNNSATEPDIEKGAQYARYIQRVRREANLGAAFSFALSWPGEDGNREGWVLNGRETGIVRAFSSLSNQFDLFNPGDEAYNIAA